MSSFQKTKHFIPTSTDPNHQALDDGKCLELVNRKHIVFHQDNARLHISLMTRQKLLQLGWEGLIHPSYTPDIPPSEVHLFWSLQNSDGKNFNSLGDCERHLQKFFAQKGWKL